jgi:hypothetical protein
LCAFVGLRGRSRAPGEEYHDGGLSKEENLAKMGCSCQDGISFGVPLAVDGAPDKTTAIRPRSITAYLCPIRMYVASRLSFHSETIC